MARLAERTPAGEVMAAEFVVDGCSQEQAVPPVRELLRSPAAVHLHGLGARHRLLAVGMRHPLAPGVAPPRRPPDVDRARRESVPIRPAALNARAHGRLIPKANFDGGRQFGAGTLAMSGQGFASGVCSSTNWPHSQIGPSR